MMQHSRNVWVSNLIQAAGAFLCRFSMSSPSLYLHNTSTCMVKELGTKLPIDVTEIVFVIFVIGSLTNK